MKKYFYLTDPDAIVPNDLSTLCWSQLLLGKSIKIAEQIFLWTERNEDGKIIINIELANNGNRSDHFAIEVLLFLRCKHFITNPIICVGFEPLHSILQRQPQNIILCSPGTVYKQLPFRNFEELHIPVLNDLAQLKPFIKPAINIKKIRHEAANWVGMGYMYRAILTIKEPDLPDPNLINPNPQNGMTYYMYQNSLEYSLLSFYYDNPVIVDSTRNEGIIKAIKEIRNKLQSKNPRILLVDDMAKDGWGKLFCYSIYNQPESDNFLISDFLNNTKNNSSVIEITINEIDKHKPELLLLDLRLSNQPEAISVESLDGYRVLLAVKKKHPGLPVIMSTATNNGQTIKKLIAAGADGVWTKQGLDEKAGLHENLNRLFEFLSLTDESLNKFSKYQNTRAEEFSLSEPILDTNVNKSPLEIIQEPIDPLIQEKLFAYLNHLRYSLSDSKNYNSQLTKNISSFSEIFIDTNIFIEGSLIYPGQVENFISLLGSLYVLAKITYLQNENNPKVIIMNSVIDEIIKLSKIKNERGKSKQFRAQLAYSLVSFMFSEEIVKTEINSPNGEAYLKPPKESVYADGYILDELANYLMIRKKKFENNFIALKSSHVLLITSDNELAAKVKSLHEGRLFYAINKFKYHRNESIGDILRNNTLSNKQKMEEIQKLDKRNFNKELLSDLEVLHPDVKFTWWNINRFIEKLNDLRNISIVN